MDERHYVELTPASMEVFKLYAEDAGNWDGNPWVSMGNITPTAEQRGNLSDLVQKELIRIDTWHDGTTYITFLDAGQQLAAELEIDLGV